MPIFIHALYWISCRGHADQILMKLAASHIRSSRPVLFAGRQDFESLREWCINLQDCEADPSSSCSIQIEGAWTCRHLHLTISAENSLLFFQISHFEGIRIVPSTDFNMSTLQTIFLWNNSVVCIDGCTQSLLPSLFSLRWKEVKTS